MMLVNRLVAGVLLLYALPAFAQQTPPAEPSPNPQPFGAWLQDIKQEALARGISEPLLDKAFNNLQPNPRVIRLDRAQPESTTSFTQYMKNTVNADRVQKGREKKREHAALLQMIGKEYGVQPRFILALWGKETSYGGFTGNHQVIRSLATLAYDGRRSAFFRSELLDALAIVDAGHITLDEMEGSWAGAMGQSQFMPSSFLEFAVDYNGDGKKDIWHDPADIFASIANYLKQSGWRDDLTWGRQVQLPEDFDMRLADGNHWKPLPRWQVLGVRRANGADLPTRNIEAAVTLPSEPHEAAYIIYRNYDVLLDWNRSRYFATAVGVLSDRIGKL